MAGVRSFSGGPGPTALPPGNPPKENYQLELSPKGLNALWEALGQAVSGPPEPQRTNTQRLYTWFLNRWREPHGLCAGLGWVIAPHGLCVCVSPMG